MSMKNRYDKQIVALIVAKQEAQRFISKAEIAIERLRKEGNSEYGCHSTKEMGAVRRAALDCKREMTNVNQLEMY